MITVHYVHTASPLSGDTQISEGLAKQLVAMNVLDWEKDETVGNVLIKHYRRASAHTL